MRPNPYSIMNQVPFITDINTTALATYTNMTKDERQQYFSKYIGDFYWDTVKQLAYMRLELHTMDLHSTLRLIASLLATWV